MRNARGNAWRSRAIAVLGVSSMLFLGGGAANAVAPEAADQFSLVSTLTATASVDESVVLLASSTAERRLLLPMSAYSIGYVSAFSYSWNGFSLPVPSGFLHHMIIGDGTGITKESVGYQPATGAGGLWGVRICNWRIDLVNTSATTGKSYTSRGTTHTGCSTTNVGRTTGTRIVKAGSECAVLYVNGKKRGTQCLSVG